MYERYCQNKLRSEALWRQFSDCAFFQVNVTNFDDFFFQHIRSEALICLTESGLAVCFNLSFE